MIRFFYHPTPNPAKIALFLIESGMEFELVPIDTRKGDQHADAFQAVNPNGKVPAIIDTEGPKGRPVRVFDSTAILLYLGEKSGRFLGASEDRGELLSWLMFIATGLGPFSGQAVHFQHMAPEKPAYAVNRYRREIERHYEVLDRHLDGRQFIVGSDYTIADMSAWGWIDRARFVFPEADSPLTAYKNVLRWFEGIDTRPAISGARAVGSDVEFKSEMDETARRALFPSNYATLESGHEA